MPLIEELPLTTTRTAQPGWAYVADTTASTTTPHPLPSTTQPLTGRKRAARATTLGNASSHAHLTSKQQKAIDARLKDLERENFASAGAGSGVTIPKVEGVTSLGGVGVNTGIKKTSNVKRILGYSRGFAHYLADEEAAIAGGGGGFVGTWGQVASAGAGAGAQGDGSKRKSVVGSKVIAAKGRSTSTSTKTAQGEVAVKTERDADGDVTMSGNTAEVRGQAQTSPTQAATAQRTLYPRYDPALDKDPLLKTLNTLPKPSERVIAALLAEPPLSYSAARATVPEDGKEKPRRWFCAVCGYWGKVKCRKCGTRCCGLMSCWTEHGCEP